MHIVDMVYFWARTMPQRPAVIQPQGIVTYRALAQAIESAAEHFARNIADKSKPVAVSVSTGPKMLVASLGLLRAGFDVIPASPSMFEQLPAAGTDTLVYERDGSTLDGGTNILFDENWLTIGPNSRKKDIAICRMMSKGGHIIYFT
jgi:acyl-CoA synthetase (AMP-forming)/AMP-acid ligase II